MPKRPPAYKYASRPPPACSDGNGLSYLFSAPRLAYYVACERRNSKATTKVSTAAIVSCCGCPIATGLRGRSGWAIKGRSPGFPGAVCSSLFLGLKFRLEGLDFQTDVVGVKHAQGTRHRDEGAIHACQKRRQSAEHPAWTAAPCNALQTPATVPGYQPRAVAVISPPSFIPLLGTRNFIPRQRLVLWYPSCV